MALVPSAMTALGANVARCVLTGAADTEACTIGLSGDAGATIQLPASFVGNSVALAGAGTVNVGDGQGLISGANLQTNTRITAIPTTVGGTLIGAGGNSNVTFSKNSTSPWRITCTLNGTPTGGAAVFEVYIEEFQSVGSGGSI